ncbi:AcrR family transcriptional regulator [Amycolatopsis lexingtonensis]|uniref:AcrR family transcriptional regulator n=1 Tax=Amycolatopsis lexingtonensis TaxID=218822 RepID=A0ABR9HZ21_9PSEU|nr:TetR family transcriptional regulator [Amycolatopsis lexingtonensis]MBE1496184.1 AcrR family transcriptional regulator [Amycolatopsis lexingtonensis]
MGRWEPNPRGRLAKAAVELFAAQGFDETTGAQIAARAGMHERSFFRLFPDKREVFFHAVEAAQREAVAVIAGLPAGTTPVDAVAAALEQRCAIIQEHADAALIRHNLVSANAELRERDLSKHAELAAGMAEALSGRDTPEPLAKLIAHTAVAVFRLSFERWITDPGHQDLPAMFRDGLGELASALAPCARLA